MVSAKLRRRMTAVLDQWKPRCAGEPRRTAVALHPDTQPASYPGSLPQEPGRCIPRVGSGSTSWQHPGSRSSIPMLRLRGGPQAAAQDRPRGGADAVSWTAGYRCRYVAGDCSCDRYVGHGDPVVGFPRVCTCPRCCERALGDMVAPLPHCRDTSLSLVAWNCAQPRRSPEAMGCARASHSGAGSLAVTGEAVSVGIRTAGEPIGIAEVDVEKSLWRRVAYQHVPLRVHPRPR